MTINVHETPIIGLGHESFEWTGTFDEFLCSDEIDCADWREDEEQRFVVYLNGAVLPSEKWDSTSVGEGDTVDVVPLTVHGGLLKGIGSIIGSLFNAVFGWLMPSQRGRDAGRSPRQGQKLETAEGRANEAKLGDVVPELAGRFKRYPDYLTPPRRYFVNQREQWLEFHACIGPGRYQINPSDVKVGDTPFSGLGDSGQFKIYEPGASLTGTTTHEHWFTVDEVGGTSSGTAGLELTTDPANRTNSNPASYTFDGNTITRSDGSFPPGWGQGTVVSIAVARTLTYAVTGGGGFPLPEPNVFTGDFAHLYPLPEGFPVVVTGAVSGTFLALEVNIDAQGQGSLQLWIPGTPPSESSPGTDPEPISNLSPGDYTLTTTVGARTYTISANNESSIELVEANFPSYSSVGDIAYSSGRVYGEWTNLYTSTPAKEQSNTYECDIFAPGGIAYIEDNGDLSNRSVGVEFQARNVVTGVFTNFNRTYTARSLNGIGFTERFTLPVGQYNWRVRRTSASATETNIRDTVHWYGLKARLPTRASYPRWTTMSIRLRSGGKIAAQSENQINVIATRILPTLQPNGTWGAPEPTRDISAFAKYITDTLGYAEDQWEMDELVRLHNDFWVPRGETCDHVFDLMTSKQALDITLAAGMSEFTVSNGAIRPVRDDVRTQFEQGYSPQNMTGVLSRTFSSIRPDTPDGVEVEYIDETTWAKSTVICALPGSDRVRLESMKLDGVTDRDRAWRIGMRRQRARIFRNWDYGFETGLEALNSEYLSYVPLFDDLAGYGTSALLVGIAPIGDNQYMLTLSEPLEWQEGDTHVVAYRDLSGDLHGPFPALPGVDDYTVVATIPGSVPTVSLRAELPHVYFGTIENWCFPALITEIDPTDTTTGTVRAVNYAPEVYLDDNRTADN